MINEKEINNDKIQAMFKRGRHINLSIFIISQITMNFRNEQSELMVIFFIYSKPIII